MAAIQTKTISSSTTANQYQLKLELVENSTSVINNTSSISWRLYLVSGDWRFTQYKIGWSVVLNGTTVSSKAKADASQQAIEAHSELTIASGSKNITHNADGSLTMSVSASIDMDSASHTPGPMSLSGTMALTTIPQKSTLTVANGTLGTAQTVTITRASTSFTHTIAYVCGSHSGNFNMSAFSGSGSTLTRSWTPNIEWSDANTTGQTVNVTLTLTTLNGSTTVGTETKTVSMAIPASVKPSCTATVEIVNDNTTVAGWGDIAVKGFSKYKVTTTFTGSQGSTLKSRSVNVKATGQILTASPATSSVLTSTNRRVVVYVTDSRDRVSDSVTVTGPTIYDYSQPTISTAQAFRCNSGGTKDESGTYLSVKCKGAVSSCGGNNSRTIQCRRRQTGGSWTSWTTLTNNTASVINAGLDPSKTYEVQFRVTDSLGGARSVTVTIATATVTMNFRAGGLGVAFGGYAQNNNTVDFTSWNVVGKVLGLGAAKDSIAENADLNSYTTYGVYGATNAIALSGTNFPTTSGGTLRVWSALGSIGVTYICQEYVDWHNTSFERYTADGGTTWSSWRALATQNWVESLLFDSGTALSGTETLTALGIGKYEANSNSVASSLQGVSTGNCPTSYNFALWVHNRVSAPRKGMIIMDSQGDIYIKQQSTASSWTSWKKLTSTTVT